MYKRILVGFLAAMIMALTGCASYDVSQDETAVEIDGYIINKTDKKLADCHDAGKSGYGGAGNDMFYYNAGQRTFSFTGASTEAELDPIAVVTSDSQTLRQPGFMKFTLTSNCDELYDFHQKVGLKYKAYTDDGWKRFLKDYFGPVVTSALNDASGTYPWKVLYQDATKRAEVENELNKTLQARINAAVGGDWIKVNGVVLSKPIASDALVSGLEATEKQKLENAAITQKNTGLLSKYDTMKDCIKEKGLSEELCKVMFLSEQGDIPFYTIPSGGSVNVSPK